MHRTAALLFFAICAAFPTALLAQPVSSDPSTELDYLFPRRSFFGQRARPLGWSHDDRYLAYLWNPYNTRGADIWLFDSKTNSTNRLTSIDLMATFDRTSLLAIDEIKKDEERRERWDKLNDVEFRRERQKFREELEKRTEPVPSYPGISEVEWANKSNEFLFVFRGDLFRWKVGEARPVRLTQTRDQEFSVEYLPDDSGFVFRRGNDIYRMQFGQTQILQINPELPRGVTMSGYRISPDGTQMLVTGSRPVGGPSREVDYIVYRDRFAQARKTQRGVAEDNFNSESTFYLFDIRTESLQRVSEVIKPFEIHKWAGGEEWQDISISEDPWLPGGNAFVYSTWKRDSKELTIMEADFAKKRVRKVWQGTSDGEHRTPSLANPFYTHDGKHIVALLDKSGWRHLHLIERIWGEERQITKGDFEVYPVKRSATTGSVIVQSSASHLSQLLPHRVDLATGQMIPLTQTKGRASTPELAHKSDQFATVLSSWSLLPELVIVDGGAEKTITESHRAKDFWAVSPLKPELFTYNNRHNDTIHGFMFRPDAQKFPGKRPVMIYVYGGPLGTGKSVEDGSFGTTDFMWARHLTERYGVITVTIDPRGQSGYSARFGKANWENPGAAQNEDLVDGAKWLIANHNADPTKMGMNGWSFGGFQTQYCMYHSPDVFTLGIAGAGPTQWQNYNTWYTGGVIGNTPARQGDYLDKFSLTKVAHQLRGPLLLLHGVEDTNVLYQDTVMVYRALLQAGKGHLVELSLDPTGGHGMGGDMDSRDRHIIYTAFLRKHWGL